MSQQADIVSRVASDLIEKDWNVKPETLQSVLQRYNIELDDKSCEKALQDERIVRTVLD